MSYPPRPPMGMPPMHPGMMHPYGFPGMMPIGMMPMIPPGLPVGMQRGGMPPSVPYNKPPVKKAPLLVPQELPKPSDGKPPVTTVFVGNISERAPDTMIRQMLQRCGNVLSWKRVQGASGKLQAFGFCEYEDPEATLRCIRLLNEWPIVDKKLVVKVDAKTKSLLDEHKKKKKEQDKKKEKESKSEEKKTDDEEREEGETKDDDKESDDDVEDEFTLREDRVAKAGLDAVMREYASDLAKEPPTPAPTPNAADKAAQERKDRKKKDKELEDAAAVASEDLVAEEDKKELISKEIRSFRDAHKQTQADEDKGERYEREREIRRRREEEREKEREREKKEREKEREREKREREKLMRERSRSTSRERREEKERERERERELREKNKDEERDRDRDLEDEEEAFERKKLERKLREKEAAYQELLKKWESRERKKIREAEKEREREEERKEEEAKEARRLKEFLEDYDDDKDDPKYYKGNALQRRLKEREKENEADERDRQREREELEELKQKLLVEGHPDPEAEIAKIEQRSTEHLLPRFDNSVHEMEAESPSPEPVEARPRMVPALRALKEEERATPSFSDGGSSPHSEGGRQSLVINMPDHSDSVNASASNSYEDELQQQFAQTEQQQRKLGFQAIKLGASSAVDSPKPVSPPAPAVLAKRKFTAQDVFKDDDEDDSSASKRKRPLPMFLDDDRSKEAKPMTAEDKRKCIKNLIEQIPTVKEELFKYTFDWSMVDSVLMERRIKPWVNKKIVEYIGEEEPTLTDFICQKVMARTSADTILNDVSMILDDEAEVFVVKMWRLLIYETEAKKLGLAK